MPFFNIFTLTADIKCNVVLQRLLLDRKRQLSLLLVSPLPPAGYVW